MHQGRLKSRGVKVVSLEKGIREVEGVDECWAGEGGREEPHFIL